MSNIPLPGFLSSLGLDGRVNEAIQSNPGLSSINNAFGQIGALLDRIKISIGSFISNLLGRQGIETADITNSPISGLIRMTPLGGVLDLVEQANPQAAQQAAAQVASNGIGPAQEAGSPAAPAGGTARPRQREVS